MTAENYPECEHHGIGCEDDCPVVPAREVLTWDIPDPKNGSVENYRKVRDIIEKKVKTMMEALHN